MNAPTSQLVERLAERLKERGMGVVRRGFLEGVSGIKHFFDLVIEDPESGKKVAASIVEQLGLRDVIFVLATRMDTRIPHVVFTSKVEPSVEKLLKNTNIKIVSLGNVLMISNARREELEERILEEISRILGEEYRAGNS